MPPRRCAVGTFVLNAAFYSPALLARDAVATDLLSDGRLDLGLGTGYVREEFEIAEIPYPTAGARVDHLRHTAAYLKENAPTIPILIAGNGDRVLRIAARYADIIGLTGGTISDTADDPLAERIALVRDAAGDRFADLELNMAITAVPTDDSGISEPGSDPRLRSHRHRRTTAGDAEVCSAAHPAISPTGCGRCGIVTA